MRDKVSVRTYSTLVIGVDHQYLLHLPVVEIVEVSHGGLGPLDEVHQHVG